jgi:23S rRNA pseudouridine955/2504/2580 synthase
MTQAVAGRGGVAHLEVKPADSGMRLDRWLRTQFPAVGFARAQKLIRSGQIRVDGGRARGETRLEAGQSVRVPPLAAAPAPRRGGPRPLSDEDRALIGSLVIHEDETVFVLNKPAGLATQGGTGVTTHVDRLLAGLQGGEPERPRLVHRLDRETSGVLLVARNRGAARALAHSLKSRRARKVYWALVRGVPSPASGRISTFIGPDGRTRSETQRVARQGEPEAVHAVTRYALVDRVGARLSWLRLEPETGRKHQLRVHLAHIGHPVIGDPRYFDVENWELPGGLEDRLHLHARRIIVPHPDGGTLDVSAELSPHMARAFALLGLEAGTAGAGEPVELGPDG